MRAAGRREAEERAVYRDSVMSPTERFLPRSMVRLALLFVIATASAGQAQLACHARDELPRGLELFLDAQGFDSGDRLVALADLDGDERSEALVYLRGSDWCGSGGC